MKRAFLLIGLTLAFVAVLAGQPAAATAEQEVMTLEFLNVGQGDAILIRSTAKKGAILVDAGTPKGVMHHLEKRGIEEIDLVALSHHHADHGGGTAAVVEEYEPKAYLDSGSSHTSKTYKRILQAVKDSPKTKTLRPRENEERKITFKGSAVVVRVFPQPPEDEDNENNNSVGLRVELGKFSVLLTGDSEDDERAWWREHADKSLYSNVTVMKLAHHGSHNGTDTEWLKAAKPELAVASCGRENSYGHPHKKTLDLLKDQKVRLKRTDEEGTITIKTDGQGWDLIQARGNSTAPGLFSSFPRAPSGGLMP